MKILKNISIKNVSMKKLSARNLTIIAAVLFVLFLAWSRSGTQLPKGTTVEYMHGQPAANEKGEFVTEATVRPESGGEIRVSVTSKDAVGVSEAFRSGNDTWVKLSKKETK